MVLDSVSMTAFGSSTNELLEIEADWRAKDGAGLMAKTTTVKEFVADICGTPLSVTMTEIRLVVSAWLGVGVQLKCPDGVMLAPAGAPVSRVKVKD